MWALCTSARVAVSEGGRGAARAAPAPGGVEHFRPERRTRREDGRPLQEVGQLARSHEEVVLAAGLTPEQVNDAVRIAATMHGVAVALEM